MPRLNPAHLVTFQKVVAAKSFSLAGEQLGISQPAVSQQIRELERRLQVRLVERTGRQVGPTPAGTALLAHAARIGIALADAEAQMMQFHEQAGGRVRIGAGATACIHLLPPLLQRLKRLHPSVTILVSTGNTADIVRRVEGNDLDAALVTMPVASAALHATQLMEDRFVAVAQRGAHDGRAAVTATTLARKPLILFEPGANTRSLVDRWFADAGFRPEPLMELGSVEAIKEMVSAGLGWSLLPELSVASPKHRARLAVLRVQPRLTRALAWIVRRDKPMNRALRTVQDGVLELAQRRAAD
ncbi:LysR family transcriptional regulator [Ramlibacter sp. AN1015]|uniref:LysR family transcriptional regulator n=1 Tax=Ramlibacter sp. AN1015 TaxID=3133428 RepID=UPI0030BF58B3